MRNRCKLSLQFDAGAMQGDVARLERDAWIDHFVTDNYDGSWTVLPLRAPSGASHPIQTIYSDPSTESFVDTPLLARCPYFQRVLKSFDCPLHAVRLMKLAAGSVIKPHHDHDLAIEHGRARLHVPVATNPDVDFRVEGERVVLQEGECWYLDLSRIHSVANRGTSDRVHLVIDVVANSWLLGQLTRVWDTAPRLEASVPTVEAIDPRAALEAFRDAVRSEGSLQDQLTDITDPATFVARVSELAAERGFPTTAHEIQRAMREARQWARQPA
jgi:hypothetical protein